MGAGDVEEEPVGVRREKVWKALGPFDEADVIRGAVFVPADGIEFFRVIDAIEVEVTDGSERGGIFLNDGERWTALELVGVVSEGSNDTAGEAGFAGAEGAGEGDNVAGAEGPCEAGGGEVRGTRGACFKVWRESDQSRKV